MRSIKHLGFAVLAAMALTALLGAGTASATQFRAEEYPTTLNGTQSVTHKLKVKGGHTLQCSTVNTTGTLSAAYSSVSLTPEMKGCVFLGLAATPIVNSCKYTLNSTNESEPFTGTMDISCSKAGDEMEFKVNIGSCVLKVPAQKGLQLGLANSEYAVRSRNRNITSAVNATGIKYTLSGVCPVQGTFEDGTLTGTSVIKGYNAPAEHAVGVYLANEQVEAAPGFSDEGSWGPVTSELSKLTMTFGGFTSSCSLQVGSPTLQSFNGELDLGISQWNNCYFGGQFSVNTNGCGLVFKATTSEGEKAWGVLNIECPVGASITFTAWQCSVSIPAQSNKAKMEFETVGTGKERKIATVMAVNSLKHTANGGLCSGFGTQENGYMSWSSNLSSSNGGLFVVY